MSITISIVNVFKTIGKAISRWWNLHEDTVKLSLWFCLLLPALILSPVIYAGVMHHYWLMGIICSIILAVTFPTRIFIAKFLEKKTTMDNAEILRILNIYSIICLLIVSDVQYFAIEHHSYIGGLVHGICLVMAILFMFPYIWLLRKIMDKTTNNEWIANIISMIFIVGMMVFLVTTSEVVISRICGISI